MLGLEPVDGLGQVLRAERPVRQRQHDRGAVVLAAVAHLDRRLQDGRAGVPLGGDPVQCRVPQPPHQVGGAFVIHEVRTEAGCDRFVHPHVGRHQPECREHALVDRHEHVTGADDPGQGVGVQRAGTSEGDQREVPRIQPPVDGHESDGVDHVEVHEVHHGEGHVLGRHRQLVAQPAERGPRRGGVQLHLTAEEAVGVDAPQGHVGVGHGRLHPAAPVAGRAGVGSRRARPHPQQPALVDPGHRAAAGTDGAHVHHRGVDRQAPFDLELGGAVGLAGLDEADVEAGTSHVHGDEVLPAHEAPEVQGAQHAAHRSGHQQVDRLGRRRPVVHEAAVGFHHQEVGVHADGCQAGGDVLDVLPHQRLQECVRQRRAHAVVLPPAGVHLVAERDTRRRVLLGDDLPHAQFVGGVHVGEQEAHGDVGEALSTQRAGGLPRPVLVQGFDDLALVVAALVHLEAVPPLHERDGLVPLQVVVVLAVHPLDEHHVAETPRADETWQLRLALQQGVGGHGGAVHQVTDGAVVDTGPADDVVDGPMRLPGRAGRLGHLHLAGLLVEQRQVGERAADVDSHAYSHRSPHLLWPMPAAAPVTHRPRSVRPCISTYSSRQISEQ